MVGCLSTLACSREVGKLSSTQALPSGRDLVKEGNSSLWTHMFYLVMHCVLLNSCNIYLQEQELCHSIRLQKFLWCSWLAYVEGAELEKNMFTNLYLSSCAMISMMVSSSTPSPVAMAEYALEPRAAWGDNCRKEGRKTGLEQQWYNKRTFCDEQLAVAGM